MTRVPTEGEQPLTTDPSEAATEPTGDTAPHVGVFGPGHRLLTTGLVLIVTLVAFESMSVATIMPSVEDDLGDLALYGWVFSAFFLGTLVGVVIAGTASDRIRPAIPLGLGLVVFAFGLIIGGIAPTMLILVVGRFLQGLGAGAMPATSYVCIGRSYPLDQRPKMFALVSSAWMLPSVIGPVIAASVAETVGWRWVFLGLLPLTAVFGAIAILGVKSVQAPSEPSEDRNIMNAVLVALGAALLLFGLGSRDVLVFIPVSIIGAAIMVPPFLRLTPAGLLRARAGLPATIAVRGLLNFGFYSADAFVPFAITSVRGLSPVYGGLAMTTASLTWTVSSWLQARWIRTRGSTILVIVGMAIIAIGTAGMLAVLVPSIPAWIGLVAWGIAGFGMGLAFSPLAHVAMELAESGQEGRTTTGLQLSDTLGAALGIGIAGVLVSTVGTITDSETTGLVLTFGMATAVAAFGAVLGRRVPRGSELG